MDSLSCIVVYCIDLQTCHCAFGGRGSGPVVGSHMNDCRSVTSTLIRARQNHYWRAELSNEHLSWALLSTSSTLIRPSPTRTLECGWWTVLFFRREIGLRTAQSLGRTWQPWIEVRELQYYLIRVECSSQQYSLHTALYDDRSFMPLL